VSPGDGPEKNPENYRMLSPCKDAQNNAEMQKVNLFQLQIQQETADFFLNYQAGRLPLGIQT
jgi:hypothetical protein